MCAHASGSGDVFVVFLMHVVGSSIIGDCLEHFFFIWVKFERCADLTQIRFNGKIYRTMYEGLIEIKREQYTAWDAR